MSETRFIRAIAKFAGGPAVGHVDEVPAGLAVVAIEAGLAVEADSLEARAPKLSFDESFDQTIDTEALLLDTGLSLGGPDDDATDKDASNQSGGSFADDLVDALHGDPEAQARLREAPTE